jgi:uncharacterized protein (TIGR00251 family)
MAWPWQLSENSIRLRVHLQPRASQNRIVGMRGEAIKIAITAPPVEGAANAALLRFLARQLAMPPSALSLLSGEKSRDKQVLIRTLHPEQTLDILQDALQRVDKKISDD